MKAETPVRKRVGIPAGNLAEQGRNPYDSF